MNAIATMTGKGMTQKVERLRRLLESQAGQPMTLAAMGEQVHASPFHLQRSFKAVHGVTPRQYQEACRLQALKRSLRSAPSVTDAIFEAGYGSASRVYEGVGARLGMTPRQYRAGAEGVAISFAIRATGYGPLLMAATDRGLCMVQFGASASELEARLRQEYPKAHIAAADDASSAALRDWMEALEAHLGDSTRPLQLPLDVQGTAFQMRVWRYLQQIPAGELRSYSEVAAAIGHPRAVRAVASACAANRVAVVIPCHRVIRGDGGLGGYRWGLERKRTLIERERAAHTGRA